MNYDFKSMSLELHKRVYHALKMAQEEFLQNVVFDAYLDEAKGDYTKSEVFDAGAFVLACEVTGGAWAVMDEYGTGSLMDTTNPFLANYRASGLWNPARSDTVIRTRPRGEYTNIFGETEESKASRPGANLEEIAERHPERNIKILVTPPSHAFRNALEFMRPRLQEIMMQVMADFPWGSFIKTEVR